VPCASRGTGLPSGVLTALVVARPQCCAAEPRADHLGPRAAVRLASPGPLDGLEPEARSGLRVGESGPMAQRSAALHRPTLRWCWPRRLTPRQSLVTRREDSQPSRRTRSRWSADPAAWPGLWSLAPWLAWPGVVGWFSRNLRLQLRARALPRQRIPPNARNLPGGSAQKTPLHSSRPIPIGLGGAVFRS
jgi:hypothetical protein